MIIYTAPNQVGASQISQIFTIPRLVASEVSHLLSHDFTHILYFFFVFQYKTQRENSRLTTLIVLHIYCFP